MHLKQITLKNFRCFESLTIDLHKQLTVVVAENAGGKTSVLDGIAKGLAAWFPHLDSAEQRLPFFPLDDDDLRVTPTVNNRGREVCKKADAVYLCLSMDYDGPPPLNWDIAHVLNDSVITFREHGDTALKLRANLLRDAIHDGDDDIQIPVFAYYGIHRGHVTQEIPDRIHEPNIDYSQRLSALVDALAPNLRDFSEIVRWFKESSLDELQWESDHGEGGKHEGSDAHYFGVLPHVRRAFEAVLGEHVRDPRIDRASKKFVVDFRATDGTVTPLRFDQLSQGYASVLALVLDLAQRLAVANPYFNAATEHDFREGVEEIFDPLSAPAIVLIDEVDLHLHPSWQQRVLGDLMRAFPRTQFIVTTHSPQVVTTVPTDCIRILKDGKVYAAPAGTDGAEAQRLLKSVFNVEPRPDTEMSRALSRYMVLVHDKNWDTQEALELRAKLDAWSKGEEPRLVLADLEIENQKWEASQ
jgi:predicted ATP-binding protein involved in virulence